MEMREEWPLVDFWIITINGWNRLGVAFQTTPGSCDAAFGLDKAGLPPFPGASRSPGPTVL